MADILNRLIGPQRVRTLLECYGADPAAWPVDERQAALALLERSPDLQSLRDAAAQLDAVMQAYTQSCRPDMAHIADLAGQIMRALPAQQSTPIRPSGYLWQMGIAASLLLISVLFFAQAPVTVQDKPPVSLAQIDDSADIFHDWAWEDVTGEDDGSDTTDSDIFPVYALVDQINEDGR